MTPAIIGFTAILGMTLSGIIITIFNSNCKVIRCCGAECSRETIQEEVDLDDINEN
tara:strand:+ start:101 stop:268 length:168 start_codon:yes stop_codon:yes gene_type:complete